MMFNKIISIAQNKLNFLYENSLFIQNIDNFILLSVLSIFVASTFMSSDAIGFLGIIVMFLTLVKLFVVPKQKIENNIFEMWLIIYFMIVIVSLCGSTLFAQSLKGFLKTFIYIGYYFSIAKYLKDNPKKMPLLLGCIALCTLVEGFWGLFQSTLHLEQISTWQDTTNINPEDVISRIYGTLKPFNPNLYGGYLVCGLPAVMGSVFYYLNKKHVKMSVFSLICTIVVVNSIFQTGCRGAYLSVLLIFACIFALSAKFLWKKYKKLYVSLIAFAITLFTSMLLFVSSLRVRFLSIFAMRNDSSNSFRFNVYQSSLEMFKDNWLLGIGVGNRNFREIYGLYMKTGFDALSSYNIYLETAVESGIFALIAFLGFLINISICAVKYIFSSQNTDKIIYASCSIIAIWAVMFHGLVDTIYFRPQLQFMFWTYCAIISSILFNENNKQFS